MKQCYNVTHSSGIFTIYCPYATNCYEIYLTLGQRTEFCNADRGGGGGKVTNPLVTQLSDVIVTQFRCLSLRFRGKHFNGTIRINVG